MSNQINQSVGQGVAHQRISATIPPTIKIRNASVQIAAIVPPAPLDDVGEGRPTFVEYDSPLPGSPMVARVPRLPTFRLAPRRPIEKLDRPRLLMFSRK